MRCYFKAIAAALSVAALTAGCRVQREVQTHTVAAADSAAVLRVEESLQTRVKEWREGVLEQVEVEFFPPAADSVWVGEQPVPIVKRMVRTTIRTHDDREAESIGERAATESVQVHRIVEATSAEKQRSRPPIWLWVLPLVLIGGAVVLLRSRLRL